MTSLKIFSTSPWNLNDLELILSKIGFQLTELLWYWFGESAPHVHLMAKYLNPTHFISFKSLELTQNEFQVVASHFPNLISLTISFTFFVPSSPDVLHQFRHLQVLKVSRVHLTSLKWLSFDCWKHSLHTLYLGDSLKCPLEDFQYLQKLTALKDLGFSIYQKVYSPFISLVCRHLPLLERLKMNLCYVGNFDPSTRTS